MSFDTPFYKYNKRIAWFNNGEVFDIRDDEDFKDYFRKYREALLQHRTRVCYCNINDSITDSDLAIKNDVIMLDGGAKIKVKSLRCSTLFINDASLEYEQLYVDTCILSYYGKISCPQNNIQGSFVIFNYEGDMKDVEHYAQSYRGYLAIGSYNSFEEIKNIIPENEIKLSSRLCNFIDDGVDLTQKRNDLISFNDFEYELQKSVSDFILKLKETKLDNIDLIVKGIEAISSLLIKPYLDINKETIYKDDLKKAQDSLLLDLNSYVNKLNLN